MGRGIVEGDVEYAQRLLQAHTEHAKVVQALIYRGVAPDAAERLVRDLEGGRQVKLDGAKAEDAQGVQSRNKQIPSVQPSATGKPATRFARH